MSLGKTGYEAYAKHTGGKTFDGRPMPRWEELPERIRGAWEVAADAIAKDATRDLLAFPPTPAPAVPGTVLPLYVEPEEPYFTIRSHNRK